MKRSELPDDVFGIPQERKYPMPDKKHTLSAIKLFNHVDEKYEKQLAEKIIENMKKYDIDPSVVGSNNRLRKYLDENKKVKNESFFQLFMHEEAEYSKKSHYPVYIILMHSGTPLANAIKKVTGDEFSHAAISFNSKLDPMYSFGAKTGENEKGLGFVTQNANVDFYKKYKSHYKIFVSFVDKKAKDNMLKALDWFKENDNKLKYDIGGLIKIFFNKDTEDHNLKYFCSRFVAQIIAQGENLSKLPSLYKPQDFVSLPFISIINSGEDFSKYDYKNTEFNLKKIKQKIYNTDQFRLNESYITEDIGDYKFVPHGNEYEVYNCYHMENSYINPKDINTKYDLYFSSIPQMLKQLDLDNGDYYIYTKTFMNESKYIGKIHVQVGYEYDQTKIYSYVWDSVIKETNSVYTELNAACNAMVGTNVYYFLNGNMKNNTFNKPSKFVSKEGLNDIFEYTEKGAKKITRDQLLKDHIIKDVKKMTTVDDYEIKLYECNSIEDVCEKITKTKAPMQDYFFEESSFDEVYPVNGIKNNIIREYNSIKFNDEDTMMTAFNVAENLNKENIEETVIEIQPDLLSIAEMVDDKLKELKKEIIKG